jgi:hypothetical protein
MLVASPFGNLYVVPAVIDNVLIVHTDNPSLPPWMLGRQFNKF